MSVFKKLYHLWSLRANYHNLKKKVAQRRHVDELNHGVADIQSAGAQILSTWDSKLVYEAFFVAFWVLIGLRIVFFWAYLVVDVVWVLLIGTEVAVSWVYDVKKLDKNRPLLAFLSIWGTICVFDFGLRLICFFTLSSSQLLVATPVLQFIAMSMESLLSQLQLHRVKLLFSSKAASSFNVWHMILTWVLWEWVPADSISAIFLPLVVANSDVPDNFVPAGFDAWSGIFCAGLLVTFFIVQEQKAYTQRTPTEVIRRSQECHNLFQQNVTAAQNKLERARDLDPELLTIVNDMADSIRYLTDQDIVPNVRRQGLNDKFKQIRTWNEKLENTGGSYAVFHVLKTIGGEQSLPFFVESVYRAVNVALIVLLLFFKSSPINGALMVETLVSSFPLLFGVSIAVGAATFAAWIYSGVISRLCGALKQDPLPIGLVTILGWFIASLYVMPWLAPVILLTSALLLFRFLQAEAQRSAENSIGLLVHASTDLDLIQGPEDSTDVLAPQSPARPSPKRRACRSAVAPAGFEAAAAAAAEARLLVLDRLCAASRLGDPIDVWDYSDDIWKRLCDACQNGAIGNTWLEREMLCDVYQQCRRFWGAKSTQPLRRVLCVKFCESQYPDPKLETSRAERPLPCVLDSPVQYISGQKFEEVVLLSDTLGKAWEELRFPVPNLRNALIHLLDALYDEVDFSQLEVLQHNFMGRKCRLLDAVAQCYDKNARFPYVPPVRDAETNALGMALCSKLEEMGQDVRTLRGCIIAHQFPAPAPQEITLPFSKAIIHI